MSLRPRGRPAVRPRATGQGQAAPGPLWPWPPTLALGCLPPRAGGRFCQGGQTSGPDWPGSGHVPSGGLGWWGGVGEPPSLSFPDHTVRATVVLPLIQSRPLTGVQGRLRVGSRTQPGLWVADGHPRRLEGPSPLLKRTWAQISVWPPSDPEPKSTTIWASVSLPVKWADCWREARGCVCCQRCGCPQRMPARALSPHPSFPEACVPGQPGLDREPLGAVLAGQGPECLRQGGGQAGQTLHPRRACPLPSPERKPGLAGCNCGWEQCN